MGCKKLILKDDMLYVINGRGGFDPSLLPGSVGGGGAWGSITGALSDQTDLQLALDAKAPLNSPTFTGTPVVPGYLTTSAASSMYQTVSGMSGYLTTVAAGTTYMPLAGGAFTGSVDMGTSTNFSLYGVGNNAASNYERFRIYWQSSILNISTQEGGTGEFRAMFMNIASAGLLIGVSNSNAGLMRITTGSVTTGSLFGVIGTMNASTAVSQAGLVVAPIHNQSGSATSNSLLISPHFLTSVNTPYLINAGTNSAVDNGGTHTRLFSVDSSGNGYVSGNLLIGTTSSAFKLDVNGTAIVRSTFEVTSTSVFGSSMTLNVGRFILSSTAASNAVNDASGVNLSIAARTITNLAAGASSTVSHYAANGFGIPTFAASNAGVTYTNASNMYLAGPPVAGTNITITNPWTLFINSGNSYFGGSVNISSGSLSVATPVLGVYGTLAASTAITQNGLVIAPTLSQTGSANGNALLISQYVTAGPNTQYLLNIGTNSAAANAGTHTKYFSVDLTGKTIIGNVASNGAQLQIGGSVSSSDIFTISASSPTVTVGGVARDGNRLLLKQFDNSTTNSGVYFTAANQTPYFYSGAEGTHITNFATGFPSSINAAAQLQVDSTTKGVLLPRMTTAQKNAILTPPEGLEVYDTGLHKKCVYTGSAWETITSA